MGYRFSDEGEVKTAVNEAVCSVSVPGETERKRPESCRYVNRWNKCVELNVPKLK